MLIKKSLFCFLLVITAFSQAAPKTDFREEIMLDSSLVSVDVVLASRVLADSTIRKGSWKVPAGNVHASSSVPPATNNWVDVADLTSAWAFYAKNYPNPWLPAAYHQKTNFTQTTTPVVTEDRYTQSRQYDTIGGTYRNVGTPVREVRTYDASDESRTVIVTAGTAVASNYRNCGAWSPDASTVTSGESFTQSRTCDVDWSQPYTFSIGGGWTDTWAGTGSQSQTATGSGTITDWVSTAGTTTAWSVVSSYYTTWTPAAYHQTSNFVQTRNVMTDEQRFVQAREYSPSTGQYRLVGSPVKETRTVTGSSESRTVVVTAGPLVDVGPHVGCSAWTPDASTVNVGTGFTQTRNCSSTFNRTYSFSIGGSWTDVTTGPVSESQAATGTKPISDWVSTAGTTTAWSTVSSYYTTWTPAAYHQTSNFVQTRNAMTDEERFVQAREYSPSTGQYRLVGSPVKETRTVTGSSESRTVVVTAGPLVDVGPHVSCSAWTPDASTVNVGTGFTQTRSCSSTFNRTYSFSIGGSWTDVTTGPVSESQAATGTKPVATWQTKHTWHNATGSTQITVQNLSATVAAATAGFSPTEKPVGTPCTAGSTWDSYYAPGGGAWQTILFFRQECF